MALTASVTTKMLPIIQELLPQWSLLCSPKVNLKAVLFVIFFSQGYSQYFFSFFAHLLWFGCWGFGVGVLDWVFGFGLLS